MNRFATTAAIAAFATLGAFAANAADLRGDATLNSAASTPVEAIPGKDAVRAADVYSARELIVSGLQESDIVNFESRAETQVRAGDLYSARELAVSVLNADDLVTVSDFSNGALNQTRQTPQDGRTDR